MYYYKHQISYSHIVLLVKFVAIHNKYIQIVITSQCACLVQCWKSTKPQQNETSELHQIKLLGLHISIFIWMRNANNISTVQDLCARSFILLCLSEQMTKWLIPRPCPSSAAAAAKAAPAQNWGNSTRTDCPRKYYLVKNWWLLELVILYDSAGEEIYNYSSVMYIKTNP